MFVIKGLKHLFFETQEANRERAGPTRLQPGLAGADLIFQWIGMVEYIPCYSARAVHWVLLPVSRLVSRKILNEQNIKRRTGQALCVFSLLGGDCLHARYVSVMCRPKCTGYSAESTSSLYTSPRAGNV
jgi:hypothetical protein